MYRSDGYRVKTNDAMYELVPYIMPYRYDASNTITVDIDLDLIQDYIRRCRKKGIQMSHMSIIIAGALRLVSQNPYLNRFVMNRKIYSRNHFCVSFVTLQPGKTEYCIDYISVDARFADRVSLVETHVAKDDVASDHYPVVATLRLAKRDGVQELCSKN